MAMLMLASATTLVRSYTEDLPVGYLLTKWASYKHQRYANKREALFNRMMSKGYVLSDGKYIHRDEYSPGDPITAVGDYDIHKLMNEIG